MQTSGILYLVYEFDSSKLKLHNSLWGGAGLDSVSCFIFKTHYSPVINSCSGYYIYSLIVQNSTLFHEFNLNNVKLLSLKECFPCGLWCDLFNYFNQIFMNAIKNSVKLKHLI